MHFDAIIIGGGLGGLTAGATLSRFGKKVLLLEQHYVPGGCATCFKRKSYVMEVGLHEMDGLHDYDTKRQIFDFLEIWDHVEFQQVPELYRIIGKDIDMVVPHGKREYIHALGEAYPEDKRAVKRLVDMMEGTLREIPKLPSGWKALFMLPLFPLLFPNTMRTSRQTIGEWLDKNIKSEALKLIIQGNLAYYGDDPYQLSLLYFSLAQSSYIGGGGHFIKGGSQQLSNYLARVIELGGGQVLLGKKVSHILIEHGRACGVQFVDTFNRSDSSTTVYAPYIIANAAPALIKDMLPPPQAKMLGKKINGLKEACSLISVYIGFNKNLREWGIQNYSTFLYGDAIQSLKDVALANKSEDWENKPIVFVDYSQIDAGLCDKDHSVGVICAVDYLEFWQDLSPSEYQDKKDRVAKIFFKRLEKAFPGITQYIDHYEVGTARTIQSYTLNPKGTPYGYAQTLSQSGDKRLSAKSPIDHLYFASAWSLPGGGFTGAIIGGFLTGLEVHKQLQHTVQPRYIEDKRVVSLIERRAIARDTFELVIERPKNFDYRPGQYVILTINNPKYTELDMPYRALSIVSHPDEPHLRFAMRASASSFKKSCLAMHPGEKCTVYGPMGSFGIQHTGRSIAFLIGGIGITPIIPMLKDLRQNGFRKEVYLFYSNRDQERAAYHAYLQQLDAQWHPFTYRPIYTSTEKRINRDTLSMLGDLCLYDFYVVGTSNFVKSMTKMLMDHRVPSDQIFYDDFG